MTDHDPLPAPQESDFLFCRTQDGQVQVRVLLAEQLAHDECEKYRTRRIQQEDAGTSSDFDQFSRKTRKMLEEGGNDDQQSSAKDFPHDRQAKTSTP